VSTLCYRLASEMAINCFCGAMIRFRFYLSHWPEAGALRKNLILLAYPRARKPNFFSGFAIEVECHGVEHAGVV
jgi:hypothetical protein